MKVKRRELRDTYQRLQIERLIEMRVDAVHDAIDACRVRTLVRHRVRFGPSYLFGPRADARSKMTV
jgi:hypothetical protein